MKQMGVILLSAIIFFWGGIVSAIMIAENCPGPGCPEEPAAVSSPDMLPVSSPNMLPAGMGNEKLIIEEKKKIKKDIIEEEGDTQKKGPNGKEKTLEK